MIGGVEDDGDLQHMERQRIHIWKGNLTDKQATVSPQPNTEFSPVD